VIKLKDILSEVITIPIEVGDTILGGKFKNKKIVVKDIGVNEKGEPTINGKSILRVRPLPKLKEGKTVSIFDFDDTLVNSLSWIYVKKNGKEIKKLDATQFAVYKPKKGEEFDFRDFDRKIRNPKLIKKNADLLRKQLAKNGRKVTILTARRIGMPVSSYLRSVGMDAYVVPLGNADPQKKAEYIEKEIKKGYTTIYFMDDSSKNIKAVDALKVKYPKVKIVTKLVKHGY
jgi:predicted Fe-Mo cluster-binding NifX family protein